MAIRSASEIYEELIKSPQDILVTPEQASQIWSLFRRQALHPTRFSDIKHRAFLQACLMSAIEGSDAMGWIETLFRSSMKPNATVKGIISALVKKGMQKYYKKVTGAPEELYVAVIDTIAWSHRSWFEDIEQGLGVMF